MQAPARCVTPPGYLAIASVLSVGDPCFSTCTIAPRFLSPKKEKDIRAKDTAKPTEYSPDDGECVWLFFAWLRGLGHKAAFTFLMLIFHGNFPILKNQILTSGIEMPEIISCSFTNKKVQWLWY